jgi:hypothetical protein
MFAPSCAKIIAAARPILISAPVINATGLFITFLLKFRANQRSSSVEPHIHRRLPTVPMMDRQHFANNPR